MRSEISRCNSRLMMCRCSGPGKAMALGMSGIRSRAVTTEIAAVIAFTIPDSK